MPPLRLFNRSWHISSDDLVLPAWVGVAFHGTWTSLIAAEVIIIGLPDDCAGKHLATSSVLWLLISFALTTVLQLVVAGISMRGAMLQEYKRAAMPTALYCLLSAYILEAAALVYATIVNFGLLADTIGTCHTADELARTSISELSLHRWFVGSTWGMLFAISGLLVVMYNLYPDRGLESWEKRVNCMSYILCCRKSLTADADGDTTASSAPTVVRLARVFGDLFYPLNFSFTDTIAAITLVGITHRSSAHGHGSSSHNHALIAAAGAGVLSAAKHEAALLGAGALLEAAVAAAAAREAKAAAELAAQNSKQNGAGQAQAQAANSTEGLSTGAAVDSVAVTQSQQEVQLADRAASSAAAVPGPQFSAHVETPAASPLRSPSPGAKGVKHRSSTGNAQAALIWGSSASSLEPSPVSCARSASNSAWEAAVRQGSALAVAPGQGFVPGAGLGSRAASPAHDAGALPARSQSTAVDSAGTTLDRGPSPSRFSYRAQSWGGSAGGSSSQQPTGRSSEQGAASAQPAPTGLQHTPKPQQTVLSSLAEANELSLAHANVLGQVESLLSPLASSEAPGSSAAEGAVGPPSGSAAAGDAVGVPAAGDAAIAAMLVNPLFSDQSAQQQGSTAGKQAAGSHGGTNSGAVAGSLAAAAASAAVATAAGQLVVTAAAKEVLVEAGAQTSDGQPVSLELLEEALHWHAYANAIYGWPMFLWSHRYRVLRCCRLCCGGCCKGVPHSARSSGGGLGISTTVTSASSAEEGTKAMDGKPGSFGNSNDSGRPVTAVVTMSSVDTDSVSPASTSAGGHEAAGTLPARQETGRPVAEAVESSAADGPAHPHADTAAAAASGWDLEQGGSEQQTAAAEDRGTKGSVRSSIGARSRRWVQSSGNIWLLQGLADALGISRESAVANAVAPGADGPSGRQPRLSSAAGGLWTDEGACGCLCGGKWGASHVPKMAPLTASQRLTNEAIMQTANIPAADLLYVNYNNLVEGLLPYSVVLDAARRCVVVAIRGSLSVEDCVTDILYDPAPLDEDWLLQQPAATTAMSAAEDCQPPAKWQPQEAAAAAAQVGLTAGDISFQQQQEQLDWPPAPALEAALQAAAANAPVPSRPMPGDSSAGGSFRSTSMKASPFASAAAAASVAARNSSTGAEALSAPPMAPSVQQPSPSQAQQQLQSGLSRMPSVPAAQAAAAAAAAAGQPLPAGGRTLKRHWSVNFGALQQQQQQQLGAKLSEQPSFMRRVGSSLRQRQQDGEQQQQLTQRPSVLESALSVLLGPWRRLTGSDTGDGYRHRHHDRAEAAAVAAEEGRMGSRLPSSQTAAAAGGASRLSSFKNRVTGSTDHSQEPGSGTNSPKRLFKTFSLNLATAVGGGGKGPAGHQQQGSNVRRRTTSSRMLAGAREQGMLQSYASEHIPSMIAPSRRSTADSWRQSQTRRTTAADRALGAARAGHRYAPMTSPATDQSAAAAAASHRSFMQQVHHQQQQQQRQHALSNMPSMRSTAPASIEPSVTAAALGAAAGAGTASEPGLSPSSGHAHAAGSPFTPWSAAAAAAGEGRASGDAQGSPKDVRSRRSTFTQLPRINSGAGAMGDLQDQQQQQQQQLAMMASVPAALLSQQQQQQQQGDARQRPASDDGGSVGGSVASSTGRHSLRSSVSDMAWRARRLGQPLQRGHQQQPQQLQDGGPTDWSLLAGAATMVPSRTAAVPQQAAGVPASAGGRLMKSYSVNFSSRPGTGAGQSPLLSMSYSARPPVAPYSAGTSVASSAAAGSAGDSGLPDTVSSVAGEAAPAQAHLAITSPFMQQQHAAADLEAEMSLFAAAAAAGHPLQLESPWALQPLLDSSAEVQQGAAAAADAEEAALADEAEAAAAAEADAAAAAAQAAAAEETPDTGAAGAQWFAHEGILNCARAIRDDLDRLGLLDQLLLGSQASTGSSKQQQDAEGCAEEGRFMSSSELPDCRGWTLMLTGHSLGAGVAALLALHYRARFASVRAWCFAPPGGLMSPAAAASLKDICYSLVSAKDMIPRMSLWTIERLRDEMMICALRCKMPKYKLLLGAAFGRKWEEHEVLRPLEELSDAEIHAFQDYRHAVVEERSLDPLRVRIAREFVPPGEVLWLERNKQLQPRLRVPNATLNACPTAASAVSTAWDVAATAAAAVPTATARATDFAAELQPNGTAAAAVQGTESSQARGLAAASSAAPASRGSLSAAAGAASGSSNKVAGSTSMLRGGSAALEAAAVAVAGKRVVSRLQPHVTDGLGIIVGGMVVSRNMFADHVPDKQLYQLKRLVRYLKRQQALGRPLPQGIAPVVVAQPPLQQGMPSRRVQEQRQATVAGTA